VTGTVYTKYWMSYMMEINEAIFTGCRAPSLRWCTVRGCS